MPSPHRNGDARRTTSRFPSTVSQQKLRRFNSLVLVFRLAAFSFSLASSVFMITNNNSNNSGSTSSGSLRWYDFDAFRYVVAGSAIVAIYSLFEMGASVWEISKDATLLPEVFQVWFDFAHDQVFAYLLISANSTGAALARTLEGRGGGTCTANSTFCVQAEISIALGFAGFLFLALLSLLSGFRVVCFLINGSRFLFL